MADPMCLVGKTDTSCNRPKIVAAAVTVQVAVVGEQKAFIGLSFLESSVQKSVAVFPTPAKQDCRDFLDRK